MSATLAQGARIAGGDEDPPDVGRAGLLSEVLAAQRPDGAFPSYVVLDPRRGLGVPDGNAFVTALVLHHLLALARDRARQAGSDDVLAGAIERAAGFLERCRVTRRAIGDVRWGHDVAGAFLFYPEGVRPEWMQSRLAPDVDDTALCAGVLLAVGRMQPAEARHLVERVLEPHRLHDRAAAARWPWAEVGAYRTWLDLKARPNPVDCTVNANAAALLARLDLRDHPGYGAAVTTVRRGLEWAGTSSSHGRAISPFYPDLAELGHAVRRAVRAGAGDFAELDGPLVRPPPRHARTDEARAVCSSADGRVHWLAPVLHAAREIAE